MGMRTLISLHRLAPQRRAHGAGWARRRLAGHVARHGHPPRAPHWLLGLLARLGFPAEHFAGPP